MRKGFFGIVLLLIVAAAVWAQQPANPVANAGHAAQPAAASNGPGTVGSGLPADASAVGTREAAPAKTVSSGTALEDDDNPYDPILKPPPLPKGKATLIGGRASKVDHVRNRLTVAPFGGGPRVSVILDERSHIYRNGVETTVLGIHKGDRVYVDTMLDGSRILAKNVRVSTENGLAEVRGQVIGMNPEKGTISVRDQLSAAPVSFAVSGATKYSSSKGAAVAGDVQPGSLIDVQFSPRQDARAVAQEIVVLARPGDDYIFSGVITNLDMRTNSFSIDNRSDDQNYEVHFTRAALSDPHALKVGAEVTARAIFDGKAYKANNVRIEKPSQHGENAEEQ